MDINELIIKGAIDGVSATFTDEEVVSWTVARGSTRPKWQHMVRFIEKAPEFEQRFGRFGRLPNFQWRSHFLAMKINITEDSDGVEIEEIVDAAFIGTPMMEYLKELKATTIRIDDRLRVSLEKQQRLLSTALLKRRSTDLALIAPPAEGD